MSRNILVTGTSSGFGKLIAHTLADAGYHVLASMRNVDGKNKPAADELTKWASDNGKSLRVVELDVANDNSVKNAVDNIMKKEGRIDVLVNNAGVGGMGITEGFDISQGRSMFDVNLFGLMNLTNTVLPSMRKNGEGLVINVTSGIGRIALPFGAWYCATKFAVEAMSESLHTELKTLGVDVAIVEPGAFPTDFMSNMFPQNNESVMAEYGDVPKMMEQMFSGLGEVFQSADAPNPQLVADEIKKLVELPNGARPLRSVVDPLTGQFVESLNRAQEESTNSFIGAFK